jgi:hypothetical protein
MKASSNIKGHSCLYMTEDLQGYPNSISHFATDDVEQDDARLNACKDLLPPGSHLRLEPDSGSYRAEFDVPNGQVALLDKYRDKNDYVVFDLPIPYLEPYHA